METRVMTEMANDANIIDTVVRAHFDTCDYTADKIQPFINKAKTEQAFTHVAESPGMVSNSPIIPVTFVTSAEECEAA